MVADAAPSSVLELWPAEFEGLREEQRAMVDAFMAAAQRQPKATDPTERLRNGRALMESYVTESPLAQPRDIAGVPCRIFQPSGTVRGVYLDIHGGGMVWGTARLNDPANAALTELGLAVVSVEYRLAPEHPFPAGPDDCFAVARWLLDGGATQLGSSRLLVGGESAGAYLAALTLLRVRDELGEAHRFVAANLVFGIYDLGGTPSQRGARGSDVFDVLDPAEIEFIRECYVPAMTNDERRAAAISPLHADLHGLPRALFTVGTADHVLDDSLFMAARWSAAGNITELAVYPDCGHGFVLFPTELGRRGKARIDAFIRDAVEAPA
jgi:acetyl esterase/lipase